MSGQRQDGTPIAEAAYLLGLSPEAVRKRLQRETLPGYKQDGQWYVLLDLHGARQDKPAGRQDEVSGHVAGHVAGRQDDPSGQASSLVTPVEVERAIARTGQQYTADLRTILSELREVYEGQIAAKDETIAAQADTIATQRDFISEQAETLANERTVVAELRRRAEAAEARVAEMQAEAAPAPASEAATVLVMAETPDAQRPAGGFWARVRRVFGGG
jgi:uncharacterized coiled-coil protein SlyX